MLLRKIKTNEYGKADIDQINIYEKKTDKFIGQITLSTHVDMLSNCVSAIVFGWPDFHNQKDRVGVVFNIGYWSPAGRGAYPPGLHDWLKTNGWPIQAHRAIMSIIIRKWIDNYGDECISAWIRGND